MTFQLHLLRHFRSDAEEYESLSEAAEAAVAAVDGNAAYPVKITAGAEALWLNQDDGGLENIWDFAGRLAGSPALG